MRVTTDTERSSFVCVVVCCFAFACPPFVRLVSVCGVARLSTIVIRSRRFSVPLVHTVPAPPLTLTSAAVFVAPRFRSVLLLWLFYLLSSFRVRVLLCQKCPREYLCI